jgi:hypothetical protein
VIVMLIVMVSENKFLSREFDPGRDGITRNWGILHNENSIICAIFDIFLG